MTTETKNLQQQSDPFASIRLPEFRNLMTGRFLFIMALRMMSTLVGWWLYELTGDPLAMGLIGLAEAVPAIALALYSGHVIDLSDKRRLLLRGVALYGACALMLLLLSFSFTHGGLKVFIVTGIYVAIFFTGIFRSFTGPCFSAILAQVVPRDLLANATTWNQGTWLTASVTGHAAGGFLIAFLGTTGTLSVICILIALGLLRISRILPKPPLPKPGQQQSTWESVQEGVRFVFRTKEVLGALTLDLFAVLFGGAVAMVPVFAKDVLKVGPIGFGWLNAAADIGAICIVLLLTFFPMKNKQGRRLFFAVGGFGCCIIIFALSKLFWLSFIALLFSGMLDGISVVVRGTILQLKTPDDMRGRVMSVNSMFINSSNEIGQFESGVMARLMGLVPSVVFGGCMTLLVVVTTWFKAPSLRKMEY
ncbi:MFS transporter [Flavihumibacter petaseus]|uniref:Multidrug efflux pump Tap n=1 Tax=Flavihumibacter petaseus NBRC 106054 TaxID=1220578 RepID=A0A0E9N198_9BACT|nr:MFS transporter [Flavihumibacter petaseus]GAO43634.1 putative major facilitator superfamily transporter [Flavihumibacter petaseus NBRC 106054]